MHKTLLRILILAKEVNKWVATKHLMEVQLQRSILLHLEDQGLLLVKRHLEEDILIKLKVEGYHQYKMHRRNKHVKTILTTFSFNIKFYILGSHCFMKIFINNEENSL